MIGGYAKYYGIAPSKVLNEPWHLFTMFCTYAAEQIEAERAQQNGK